MLKDLLKTCDLDRADLALLLHLAHTFKANPYQQRESLSNDTVVLHFNKPSTRTRLSMETAVVRLGGMPIMVGAHELQLGRGETIEDTAKVISRYARAFIVRTFADRDVERFAAAASIPVVNALTDGHHPCQSLADLMTLQEKKGDVRRVSLAWVGDGNNVCHSLIQAAALSGLALRVATPPGYEPNHDIVAGARDMGANLTLTHDPHQAADGADAIYTDTWVSMGDADREQRLKVFASFQLNAALLARAKPDAVVMHCLPDHRGEEITAEVVDGPQSVVFDQAENRLHTSIALLHALVQGRLRGQPLR